VCVHVCVRVCCRESGGRGSGAACVAGSSVEASLLSEEEYLLLTGRLHSVLRPFMMRRLKEAVATELPGKVGCGVCVCVCVRGGGGWPLRSPQGGERREVVIWGLGEGCRVKCLWEGGGWQGEGISCQGLLGQG